MTDHEPIQWPPAVYKYEHIADVIRRRIADGTYQPGEMLSEVRFEQEFDVSRPTVRTAFKLLRAEGLIVTRPNLGSFVTSRGDVLD